MSKEESATRKGADQVARIDDDVELKSEDIAAMRARAYALRDDPLQEILARREQTLREEGVAPEIFAAAEETKTESKPATDAAAQVEKQTTEAPKDAADKEATEDGEVLDLEALKGKRVKIKIDGVEQIVDATRLVADAQKTGAADKRLANAVEKERQAEQKLRDAESRAGRAVTTEEKAEAEAKVAVASEEYKRIKKEYHAALYSGDEDKADKLFDQMIDARGGERSQSATPVNVEDIIQRTVQATKQTISVESALSQAAKDYPQINGDSDYERSVADRITTKRTGGMPTEQAITEAYAEVAEKFGLSKSAPVEEGRPTQKVATTRDEKRAAKEGIQEVPSAHARASKDAPKVLSNSEVIAQMAAARSGARV